MNAFPGDRRDLAAMFAPLTRALIAREEPVLDANGISMWGYIVLTALADGPRHRYGILREVVELSQRRGKLKIGSLYGVLDRLSADGLIEPDREEAHDGRLRRYYRLTADGRRALVEEADLRASTARVVRARLGLTAPDPTGTAG